MPVVVDAGINQQLLDSLREVRKKLYSISESELNSMSLEDQIKYGDSLRQTGRAILKLEAAKLKEVNNQFKARELELKNATVKLEKDINELKNWVEVVRVASKALNLIGEIINLL